MSRVSPFPTTPTRRAKSPAPPPTQPLAINRPGSRPVTPASSARPSLSSPIRPARSDLRSRVTSQSSVNQDLSNFAPPGSPIHASSSNVPNPSAVSTQREVPSNFQPNGSNHYDEPVPRPRFIRPARSAERPISTARVESDIEPLEISPSQMNALNAFRQAGQRRAMRFDERDLERQRERELEDARQKKMKERTMGMRGKAKAGDVDAILDDVEAEWKSVLDPDFNPVDLALFLLDEEDHDIKMESFQRTKKLLKRALKGTIDNNYRAFEAALPQHSFLSNSLTSSQTEITKLRTSLTEVKESVGSRRADLVQLWTRGQQLEEMIKVMDQIEYLKSVPDLLESLMSEKRLLPAAALLMSSLKIIGNETMQEIGALSDLRSYLLSQETSLREILLEELNSHLFLKTFWCDSRWIAYSPNQEDFPPVPFDEESSFRPDNTPPNPSSSRKPTKHHTHLSHYLHNLTLKPNEPPYDLTATDFELKPSMLANSVSLQSMSSMQNSTPESDSFTYLEHVLESLAVLGKLSVSLDAVSQRLPIEIFNLVEITLSEVSERVEGSFRSSLLPVFDGGRPSSIYVNGDGGNPSGGVISIHGASGLRLTALEQLVKDKNREVLRDLFWTLYSKLDAVVQGLKVVSETANRIASRRNFKENFDVKPGSLFPLDKQWLPIQAEVRHLLNDYLINEETTSSTNRNPLSSINDTLRQLAQRPGSSIRNPEQIRLFRFADSSNKIINKSLKGYEDQLTLALRATVPGLANQGGEASSQATFTNVGLDDRLTSAGQHRTLLPPDVFHVVLLFQPTLAFLDRMVGILPAGAESVQSSSLFLDEFVLNNYLPQLEEKVTDVFHTTVSGPEAFREDSAYRDLNPQPLIKASVQILALVNTLCAMLRTTPFHKEKHSRLILGIIVQFYQQCSDQFRELVTRESMDSNAPPVILGAQWAQNQEMSRCLASLWDCTIERDRLPFNEKIGQLELSLIGQNSIPSEDILPSIRDLEVMCHLYSSLAWFLRQLSLLRPLTAENPTSPDSEEATFMKAPATLLQSQPSENLQLLLTKESAAHLDAVLKTYRQLTDVILYTIRIDVRCRVIRHLTSMLRQVNYKLDRDSTEPDPSVIDLNSELGKCDEATGSALPPREHQFVFEGIGGLAADLIVGSSRSMRALNENGVKKIQRNILTLQQSFRTLHVAQKEVDLEKAKRYWSMYFMTPQQILMGIRHKKTYTFEEYDAMLRFTCGVQTNPDGQPITTDPNYSSHLIKLHELMGTDAQ